MREFSLKARFSFRSLPEVTEAVSIAYERIKARRPGIEGKMSREVAYNAILLHFAELPVEDQLRIFDSGLARLVPLLADPAPPPAPVDPAPIGPSPRPVHPGAARRLPTGPPSAEPANRGASPPPAGR